MGCTASAAVRRYVPCLKRERMPVHAAGLAAPDDGQYSIPDPYSTTEGRVPAHIKDLHVKTSVNPHDSDTALSTATTRDGDAEGRPRKASASLPPRARSRSRSREVSAVYETPESKAAAGATAPTMKKKRKIPPMLGAIGRSKTERILSFRQKRAVKIRAGLLKDARGIALGRIEGDGTWVGRNNSRQAVFKPDGTIESHNGRVIGSINAHTGSVLNAQKSPIGEILPDGSVRDQNANVGHVTADGVAFNLSGQKLGSCDAGPAVSGYIHFFSDKGKPPNYQSSRRTSTSSKGRRRSSHRDKPRIKPGRRR